MQLSTSSAHVVGAPWIGHPWAGPALPLAHNKGRLRVSVPAQATPLNQSLPARATSDPVAFLLKTPLQTAGIRLQAQHEGSSSVPFQPHACFLSGNIETVLASSIAAACWATFPLSP